MSLCNWFDTKRARQRQDQIDKGFGWVMISYYRHKWPVAQIIDLSYGGSWDMSDSGFKEGVGLALDLLPQQDCDDPHNVYYEGGK